MYRVNAVIIYLVVINIVAFGAYGADKKRAIKKTWRIPEKTLLFLAFIGGSVGAYIGMQMFRHKTQKPLFKIGVPGIILLHAMLALWWIWDKI